MLENETLLSIGPLFNGKSKTAPHSFGCSVTMDLLHLYKPFEVLAALNPASDTEHSNLT